MPHGFDYTGYSKLAPRGPGHVFLCRDIPMQNLGEHVKRPRVVRREPEPIPDEPEIIEVPEPVELPEIIELPPVECATEPAAEQGPVLVSFANIEPREVRWLWRNRIPAGRITLVSGRPGEGKSYSSIDIASRVSTGSPWPDGSGNAPQGSIIIVAAEDDPHDVIRPRLDAHRADVGKVTLLRGVRRANDAGEVVEDAFTLFDRAELEEAITRLGDCRLVIIDPIGSFIGGSTDAHRDNEVRAVLQPLHTIAERHGVAMLLLAHRRKGASDFADDTVLGSRAFTGIARASWHLTADPENKARRLLLPGKMNLCAAPTGLAFTLEGDPACVTWERGEVDMDANDGIRAEARSVAEQQSRPKMQEAADWLLDTLRLGPRMTAELLDEAKNGPDIAEKTLRRAAKELVHVEAYREKIPGPWWWRLPSAAGALKPQDGHPRCPTIKP